MKVLLSSIAKNDIRLLMRVFKAEGGNRDIDFLEDLKKSIAEIVSSIENSDIKNREMQMCKAERFPVDIHYLFEENDSLFITAIFRN